MKIILFINEVCHDFIFLGLTWVLVYRTEKYQKLKGEVEKQSKKCKYSADNVTIIFTKLTYF